MSCSSIRRLDVSRSPDAWSSISPPPGWPTSSPGAFVGYARIVHGGALTLDRRRTTLRLPGGRSGDRGIELHGTLANDIAAREASLHLTRNAVLHVPNPGEGIGFTRGVFFASASSPPTALQRGPLISHTLLSVGILNRAGANGATVHASPTRRVRTAADRLLGARPTVAARGHPCSRRAARSRPGCGRQGRAT